MPMTTAAPRTISRQERLERKHAGRPGPRPVATSGQPSSGAPVDPLSHRALSMPALNNLVDTLNGYGNVLSDEHTMALAALTGAMTNMAAGGLTGRWAYGLPTGMGKTSAIIAWCARLAELGLDDVSVAVSASKVEALCALKRNMIEAGVPEGQIGLIHSKRYDPDKVKAILNGDGPTNADFASEPSEGLDRQIMLVTHERVRGCSMGTFNLYRGKPRNLLLYDETLIVSDSVGIPINRFGAGVAYMKYLYRASAEHQPLIDFLTVAVQRVEDALDNGPKGDGERPVITIPPIAHADLVHFKRLASRDPQAEQARQFLDIADQDIRVMDSAQGGVVWYNVSVPREIENILILDASNPIRKLVQLDRTITDVEDPIKGLDEVNRIGVKLADLKSFENVTVRQMFNGGGRSTMEQSWRSERAEDRKIIREVIDIVRGIPEDEAVLVFVYVTRAGRYAVKFRPRLLRDLEDAGVDLRATVEVQETGKDGVERTVKKSRINVATWGMETDLNRYGHCGNVILAGVLQRAPIEMAALYVGQSDDINVPVSHKEVRELLQSEVCHCIYQALSRGSCRFMTNGKARKMAAWFIHKDDTVKRELERVMPGAKWLEWRSTTGINTGAIAGLVKDIEAHLGGLTEDVVKVSTMKLRKDMAVKDVPGRTWTHAINRYLEDGPEWLLQGRSLVRAREVFSQS